MEELFKQCLLCGVPHYNNSKLCFKCQDKDLTLYNKELIGKDFEKTMKNINEMVEVIFNYDIQNIRLRR